MTNDGRKTFEAGIKLLNGDDEVTVVFYEPTEGQMTMLARGASMAQRMPGRAVHGIAMILDVIDALIVSPDQRDWFNESMIQAVIDINALSSVLDAANNRDDAPVKPKLPVKRARSGGR